MPFEKEFICDRENNLGKPKTSFSKLTNKKGKRGWSCSMSMAEYVTYVVLQTLCPGKLCFLNLFWLKTE